MTCTFAFRKKDRPYDVFFFIIFVDVIFTTLFERAFTNIFDVSAQMHAIPCVYRARNAD